MPTTVGDWLLVGMVFCLPAFLGLAAATILGLFCVAVGGVPTSPEQRRALTLLLVCALWGVGVLAHIYLDDILAWMETVAVRVAP